jgi:hypothetical protein
MSTIVKMALFFTLVHPTTVPVERGFSIRNQIKTALKNRMRVDLLSAMMLINVETGRSLGKKIARRAAEIWMFEEGKRRRKLDDLKSEIEKEYETLLKELMEEERNIIVEEDRDESEDDGDSEVMSALDIVFQKEKIKNVLNDV